jgi:hypothetical protein
MRLADRIAQCKTPFRVQNRDDKSVTLLTSAATFADEIETCPTRYVFSDDLTRLCTALAYSKGARTVACTDFLRIPAQRMWLEWCEQPWAAELARYGINSPTQPVTGGRRGAYIQASSDGKQGLVRTFWSNGEHEAEVLASSMEAYFDFDAVEGEEPVPLTLEQRPAIVVGDDELGEADILSRCFRFRFERTWDIYYANAQLQSAQRLAVIRHSLGTIAIAMPVLLAFFLLLATRPGLPRRPATLERLNEARFKAGKPRLLDHVEVSAPLLPEYTHGAKSDLGVGRRMPRLHHVRGHLVRRGSQLFWRIPHMRGSARAGHVKTRTVTWNMESAASASST